MKFTLPKILLGFILLAFIFSSCFKDELLKEINDLRGELTTMQKRNDSLNNVVNVRADSLSKALAAAQKRSDSLSNVLKTKSDSLSNALGITNANLASLSRSVDSIKTQIVLINGQLTQLNTQLTTITTQLASLNQQLATLGGDVSQLAAQYQALSASLQTINAQIAALQAEQLKLLDRLNLILLQLNPPVDITTGLVAYYPFNGNAGDSSGNGNHGIISNALPSIGKNGIANNGYLFNGSSSFISIPRPFFNGTRVSQFSLSVTFKLNSSTPGTSVIWSKNGFWQGADIHVTPEGKIGFSSSIPTFQYQGCGSNLNLIEVNKWYTLTMVYDNSSCSLYLNGLKIETTSSTNNQGGGFISNTVAGFVDFAQTAGGNSNSTNLFGCANSVSTGNVYLFNGVIDEYRLYNKILTQTEITYLATH